MASFRSVLLVDDSRADNFLHRELIREADFAEHVAVARDGVEALDYLNGSGGGEPFPPELVLLDINMPRMDGFEFLEACAKLELPELSIVMLTTSHDPEDEARARRSGRVTEFLHKPLSVAELKRLAGLAEAGAARS